MLRDVLEKFFIQFSHRGAVMIALLLLEGPVLAFRLDARIGLALGGLVFTLNGIGHILNTWKNYSGGGRCFVHGLASIVVGFGLFVMIGALVMALTGTPIDAES